VTYRGWGVYGFSFGSQYPCYTIPSTTLVPATTPTVSDLTVVTGRLFARQFLLNISPVTSLTTPSPQPVQTSGHHSKLVEIVVSIVVSLMVIVGICILLWCLRQRRRTKSGQDSASAQEKSSFKVIRDPERPELPAEPPGRNDNVHELGPSESQEVQISSHEKPGPHPMNYTKISPIVSPF
jgi:Na+/melibiose symporter-like transporter